MDEAALENRGVWAPRVVGCEDTLHVGVFIPRPEYWKKIHAAMKLSGFQVALPCVGSEMQFPGSFLNPLEVITKKL